MSGTIYRHLWGCLIFGSMTIAPLAAIAAPSPSLAQATEPAPVSTETTISLTGLTIPSFWWSKELLAEIPKYSSKLIEDWAAYAGTGQQPGRVDFVVNRQLWSSLDYIERYGFVDKFGATARSYGYNIRVLNSRKELLAAYTCDFSAIDILQLQTAQNVPVPAARQLTQTLPCTIALDSTGRAGFRNRTNPFAASAATPPDTARP